MKKIGFLTSMLFLMTAAISLTACSSDDDGNGDETPVTPPANMENAAKYEITDDNSPYKYIELTAGEEYIIEYKDNNGGVSLTKKHAPVMRENSNGSSGYNYGLKTGTYKKTGEYVYALDGFGTVTFTESSMTVQDKNGTKTYKYRKTPKISGDINSLCRTWTAEQYHFTAGEKGGQSISKTFGTFEEFEKFLQSMGADDDDMGYENEIWYKSSCDEMIISPFGTLAMQCKVYSGMKYLGRFFLPAAWMATGKNKGAVPSAFADEGNLLEFELVGNNLKAYLGDEDEEGFEKLTITYKAK
ncbi:hypothetical protein HPS54_09960 [Prevotella sp. PCHR]|uniref:DUF4595 domain-containing protein n=1 Tax=Xylanibacter caecicola TaxID=2736294 RepID=A0ABX2B3N3_9BACT|nr:hypothetical protein [Xylanibacter caecicola]NPE25836.1 hypothetical protein [Xylanibacter caecicola]